MGPDFSLPSRNASDEWQQQAYIFAISTVEKSDQADILAHRSTTARPNHYPGPREAERALVKSRDAERVLAKAKARQPLNIIIDVRPALGRPPLFSAHNKTLQSDQGYVNSAKKLAVMPLRRKES